MGRRDVQPPKELADQIWGPGFVQLDFEDDPIKYDCIILGTPGDDVNLCFSVWLTEEVGEPGGQEYRLKHFPPGRYAANFVEWDDVTGRPIFERAVVLHVPKTKETKKKPPAKKATSKKPAKKATPNKPTAKKPATKKATPKPAKKAAPKSTRKRGEKDGK